MLYYYVFVIKVYSTICQRFSWI